LSPFKKSFETLTDLNSIQTEILSFSGSSQREQVHPNASHPSYCGLRSYPLASIYDNRSDMSILFKKQNT